MTKKEMIDVIYDAIGPSNIGFQVYTDEYNLVIMLGDVLDRIQKNIKNSKERKYKEMMVLAIRKHKREPIEKQSKECVLFIYEQICTTTTNE